LKNKIRKLREKMKERELNAFVVFRSLRYFTDTTAGKALVVPLEGEPILICSRLERDRTLQEGWIKDVRAFSAWRAPLRSGEEVYFMKPHELLATCLRELGSNRVGYDVMGRSSLMKLKKLHPAGYQELPELVQEVRKIKTMEEVRLLRKSAELSMRGLRAAEEMIKLGVREIDVAAQAEYEMRRAGSEGTPFPTIVASGKNSWLPHASATTKKINRRELVVVDVGATHKGYVSDLTRTFALSPTKKQLALVQLVKRAQRAAISRIRDGTKAADVDSAARKLLTSAGYGRFSPHGTGHGVGVEIHEPPSLAPESKDVLRAGMTITVEPGVYVKGLGGARWEDMLLVKRNGCELLTPDISSEPKDA
jgi:Xaa-Pro dipeptidase